MYQKLYGVDLSQHLICICRENLVNFDNIIVQKKNALEFDLPNENFLCFMFNPFSPEYHKLFFNKNINHFKEFQGFLLLCDDQHRGVALKSGFVIVDQLRKDAISLLKAA